MNSVPERQFEKINSYDLHVEDRLLHRLGLADGRLAFRYVGREFSLIGVAD